MQTGATPLVRRLTAALAAVLRATLIVAALVMVAAITLQVVARYVFGWAPPWSEELAVLMFSWATMGGLALGVREGFHVRLTLALDPLGRAPRAMAERTIHAGTALLGAYLAWSGLRFYGFTTGSVSAAMAYPIEILNIMAPLAGGMIAIFALEHAVVLPEPASQDPV